MPPSKQQTLRDDIRAKVFSGDTFKREPVEAFGATIEIRQTTLGRVLELQEKLGEDRKIAIGLAFIEFCYVPGTDERLFSDEDLDLVLGLPFGDDFQKAQTAINKMMGITEKEVDDAKGNSQETSGDTTS